MDVPFEITRTTAKDSKSGSRCALGVQTVRGLFGTFALLSVALAFIPEVYPNWNQYRGADWDYKDS